MIVRARVRTLMRLAFTLGALVILGDALWQFPAAKTYVGPVFASTALVAVVIGMAAQGSLQNVVAGVVLAFSQPVLIRDNVTIDDHTGRVEHIGLAYTRVRRGDGSFVEFPNALLAQKAIVITHR